jgi:hypothetical protein
MNNRSHRTSAQTLHIIDEIDLACETLRSLPALERMEEVVKAAQGTDVRESLGDYIAASDAPSAIYTRTRQHQRWVLGR